MKKILKTNNHKKAKNIGKICSCYLLVEFFNYLKMFQMRENNKIRELETQPTILIIIIKFNNNY